MDVQYTPRELADEKSAQQAHVTGQANQLHPVLLEQCYNLAVIGLALHMASVQCAGGKAQLPGTRQSGRRRAIRKHIGDLGVKRSVVDVSRDRFEIRSSAGKQNPELPFAHW